MHNHVKHSLWTNSNYSLLKSSIKLSDYIKYAKKHNLKWLALTDINSTSGLYKFYFLCKENNIKPILGLEYNFKDESFLIYAKTIKSLKILFKLSSALNDNYLKKNNSSLINYVFENLKQIELDDLIIIVNKINKENNSFLKQSFKSLYFNNNDFTKVNFLENKKLLKILKAISLKEYHDLDYYLKKEIIIYKNNNEIQNEIVNLINIDLKENYFSNNLQFSSEIHNKLKKQCFEELEKKFDNKNIPNNYINRLNHELNVYWKLRFSNYPLIVADYINYAKNNGIIVGPGRGSAPGSLVNYVLNITTIDPIKNNLLFERFLNSSRHEYPDIDVDVEDRERIKIINYIVQKYGSNHCAQILTFQRMGIKGLIRDIFRIIQTNINFSDLSKEINLLFSKENLCKSMTYNESKNPSLNKFLLTPRVKYLLNDTTPNHKVWNFVLTTMGKLFNFPRNYGIHAAGIIISKQNINEIVGTIINDNYQIITQLDMFMLNKLGFLKMDILGLTNLSIIYDILRLIYKNNNKFIDIYKIDFFNKKVFEMLSKGDTFGIFQLESYGMTKLLKKMQIKNFNDIVFLISLFRPGPMENINIFLFNRKNPLKIKYINNVFKKITKDTYGILIFQEQIMQLASEITNFSNEESDIFRMAISKKNMQLLYSMKEKFYLKGKTNNYSIDVLDKLFNLIEKFGNYAFNKSHATSYATISYWMAYLKANYYSEFSISFVNNFAGNDKKIITCIEELNKNDIKYLLPCIQASTNKAIIKNNEIILPFWIIKGIGPVIIKKILLIRKNNPFSSLKVALFYLSKELTKNQLKIFIESGTFDVFKCNRQFLIKNLNDIYIWSNLNNINAEFFLDVNKFEVTKEDLLIQNNHLIIRV